MAGDDAPIEDRPGQRTRRRWTRAAAVVGCVLVVVALGLAARQGPDSRSLAVGVETDAEEGGDGGTGTRTGTGTGDGADEPPADADDPVPTDGDTAGDDGASDEEPGSAGDGQPGSATEDGPGDDEGGWTGEVTWHLMQPVAGAEGTTLYALTRDGKLLTADLGLGRVAEVALPDLRAGARPGAGPDAFQLVAVDDEAGGGVIVVPISFAYTDETNRSSSDALYVAAPDVEPVPLGPAQRAFPSAVPGRVWLVEPSVVDAPFGPARVREVGLDGGTSAFVDLPPGVQPIAGVQGGLLVEASGTLLVLDPQRDRRAETQGRTVGDGTGLVLAAGPQGLVRRVCDERLRCGITAGTLDEPDARMAPVNVDVALSPWLLAGYGTGTLSPDGRRVAVTTDDPLDDADDSTGGSELGYPAVLDLSEAGLLRPPESFRIEEDGFGLSTPLAWSPSGEWLFTSTYDGALAWRVFYSEVVPVELPVRGVRAIAVG